MLLTDRFSDALTFAERLHRRQNRKGNEIPYVAHLLAVAAIALEWGADEDVAIAALLHDAAEDQGGPPTLAAIEQRFGTRVAGIVAGCTDSLEADPVQKAPWRERKEAYLAHLAAAEADVALVSAADKLHNLTALVRDVRHHGPATLDRFNAGAAGLFWYFGAVADALDRHAAIVPVAEIREKLAELRDRAAAQPTSF